MRQPLQPPDRITSRSNALVKQARAVRDGQDTALIFIEGVRLGEAAAQSKLFIDALLYTEKLARDERAGPLLQTLSSRARRVIIVDEDVFTSISDMKTPPGLILLAQRPVTTKDLFTLPQPETPLLVLMHRVNNPSNAGAMVRVAEAAGATGIIATEGTTDLFSPKSLRGAMGSTFRLPIWTGAGFTEAVEWCAQQKIQTVATDVRAPRLHTEIDWTMPRVVIVGAEASGLDASEMAAAGMNIRIPMRPPVESLNVTTALAVILYEAARQRAVRAL